MSRCDAYQELISRMLDEPLTDAEQADLDRHLKTCEECSAFYQALTALSQEIGADLEEPPEGLHENIMAEIRRSEIKKQNRLRPIIRVALTAAACVALVAAVSLAAPRLRGQMAASAFESKSMTVQANRVPEAPAEMAAEEEAYAGAKAACGDPAEMPAPTEAAEEPQADSGVSIQELFFPGDWAALFEHLGGEATDLPRSALQADLFAVITLTDSDGETRVPVYLLNGTLFFYDAAEDIVYRSDCTEGQLGDRLA